jgi:hypothetical protein
MEDQVNKYTCPNGRVFFQNSIVWGVIGPQRVIADFAFEIAKYANEK